MLNDVELQSFLNLQKNVNNTSQSRRSSTLGVDYKFLSQKQYYYCPHQFAIE
jgi:hypothetical protein